jgi:hypothetical protein
VLPPYGPELNPVENVWQCLRGNHPQMGTRQSIGPLAKKTILPSFAFRLW